MLSLRLVLQTFNIARHKSITVCPQHQNYKVCYIVTSYYTDTNFPDKTSLSLGSKTD